MFRLETNLHRAHSFGTSLLGIAWLLGNRAAAQFAPQGLPALGAVPADFSHAQLVGCVVGNDIILPSRRALNIVSCPSPLLLSIQSVAEAASF